MDLSDNLSILSDQLTKSIQEEVAEILASSFGLTNLKAFFPEKSGNFPYQWSIPGQEGFNVLTYHWISQNLAPRSAPDYTFQSGSFFTEEYSKAIEVIKFQLSKQDQGKEGSASSAEDKAMKDWNDNYPTSSFKTIEEVGNYIGVHWAPEGSPLTYKDLLQVSSLQNALPRAPMSASMFLIDFGLFVSAYHEANQVQKYAKEQNDDLQGVLNNLQHPGKENLGMQLSDGSWVPTYTIGQDVETIRMGLKDDSHKVAISISLERNHETKFNVVVGKGKGVTVSRLGFITMGLGNDLEFFMNQLAVEGAKLTVDFTFEGITQVNYSLSTYSTAQKQGWFYMPPIQDAIKNTGKDVSSFQFTSYPQIDFSTQGPFGYTVGLAISQSPQITIRYQGPNATHLQTVLSDTPHFTLGFLGTETNVSTGGSETDYSKSVKKLSDDSFLLTLSPPVVPPKPSEKGLDRAWVLGAMLYYPASHS